MKYKIDNNGTIRVSFSPYNLILSNEIRKDVIETESQQKLLRGMLKSEFHKLKYEMKKDFESDKEKFKNEEVQKNKKE